MSRLGTLKYDIVIYVSLFIAFICAISSVIAPTQAVSEQPKETQKEDIKTPEVEEPVVLNNVDKYSVAQKYLDSIIDQIQTDKVITYEMMSTWTSYSIEKMTYKKEIMENYYRYEVEIKVNGTNLQLPENNSIISHKTDDMAVMKVYMNMYYSQAKNGYLIKSIDLPSEI